MKYLFNPATNEFEPLEPTMRERFALGGSIETPKRGLVTEPGSYAGESFSYSDFARQLGIKPQTLGTYALKNPAAFEKINKYFKIEKGTTQGNPITYIAKKNVNLAEAINDIKTEIGRIPAAENPKINKFASKLVSDANAGERFVAQEEIANKVQNKFKIKSVQVKQIPALADLETRVEKADKVLRNMLIDDKPLKGYFNDVAAERVGMNKISFRRLLDSGAVKTYNVIKDQGADVIRYSLPKGKGTYDYVKNLSLSEQLSKALDISNGRPTLSDIDTSGGRANAPRFKVMQFAFRNWVQNEGKGDVELINKKGKPIPYEFGKNYKVGDISFKYKNKIYSLKERPFSVNNLSNIDVVKSNFPEVYQTATDLNNFSKKEIDNPFKPGTKIRIDKLVRKIQVDGYKYKPTFGSFAILHGPEGVKKKPFTGLSYNTSDINAIESSLFNKVRAGIISNKEFRKAINNLRSQFPKQNFQKSIEDRILDQAKTIKKSKGTGKIFSIDDQVKKLINLRNTAQNVFNKLPLKGLRIVPGAAAAAIDYGVFAGLFGMPIDEAMVGASGWLTKKPELGKALGTIATQYSEGKINLSELRKQSLPILKEIAKEQLPESKLPPVAEEINEKMGEGTIKIADEVPQPESAERRKMFDDFNERFGDTNELEISDIDNPFMAAMGGRVGFQDGSPNPLFKEIITGLDNPDVMDSVINNNKVSVVDKFGESIYGKEGDRTLMQTFNTMFANPKAYPYYAQEIASGAANIPELAFRFPAALAYLFGKASLATTTGDLSQVGMEDVKKAIEILDPKITKAVKEKIGFKDMLEESREKATGPQRTTGGILELGAEIPGPATPYFLIKAFPRIAKQIRNLVGSASAAKKVNEELEKRLAVETVDQTRRDILLAAGAGGAVALLKFLGLDNLIKTTKVAKAAPEIITKGGTPKYFFDFINLIKSKGDDITDKAAVIERQKVYDYNGYTMYENLDSGRITIRKDTEGGASYYVGDGEYDTVDGIIKKEEIVYDPPETIINEKGKSVKVPDTYEENTMKPDYDGGEGDMESGLESIDDVLDLLAKDGKKYSLDELKEMGINPEGIGDDFLLRILKDPTELKIDKIRTKGAKALDETRKRIKSITGKLDKAGGGIIKLAGDDSGPPPKSGPTPHGLPYVVKNVRPIKERK